MNKLVGRSADFRSQDYKFSRMQTDPAPLYISPPPIQGWLPNWVVRMLEVLS